MAKTTNNSFVSPEDLANASDAVENKYDGRQEIILTSAVAATSQKGGKFVKLKGQYQIDIDDEATTGQAAKELYIMSSMASGKMLNSDTGFAKLCSALEVDMASIGTYEDGEEIVELLNGPTGGRLRIERRTVKKTDEDGFESNNSEVKNVARTRLK